MNADFKQFAPHKDTIVTVTRKLTAAERKDKQLKAFTDYVVNELFYLHNYKQLAGVVIRRHNCLYEFKFVGNRVSVNNSTIHYNAVLQNGTSEALKKVLLDRFDICDIARLLKRAYKQVNDKRALKGNKPQPKIVKQKVIKKTELEMFAEEFKKLQAKYPDVSVSSARNGSLMAYGPDPLNMYKTACIPL